jgi:hypothetical protein
VSEAIKTIQNLPYKTMKKVMEKAYKEMINDHNDHEMLPIQIDNEIHYVPEPVWQLIQKLATTEKMQDKWITRQ